MKLTAGRTLALLALSGLLLSPVGRAYAQEPAVGSVAGIVIDSQKLPVPGVTVIARLEPSGKTYQAVTGADGRFELPGLLVGGPYTITASLSGFQPHKIEGVDVSPGAANNLEFTLNTVLYSEEVVVTAQKREESVREVPLSISVVGGDRLEELHATQLQDYIAYVPGVVVETSGAPGSATISIRGLSPLVSATMVGTYIDEAPVGSSGGWTRESVYSLDLMPDDVERIEILRGPQGTLYGANTMGGILKYVTRVPQLGAFEGKVGIEVGNQKAGDVGYALRGSLNAPLVQDRLAVRASAYRRRTGGYIDNPFIGREDENDFDQYGGRAALLWQAAPGFSVKGSALYQKSDSEGFATVDRPLAGGTPFNGDLTNAHPLSEPFRRQLYYYSATLDWNIKWANLISATSYSRSKTDQISDVTATFGTLIPLFTGGAVPEGFSSFENNIRYKKFTEEVRLASPSSKSIEWLLGFFYTNERSQNLQDLSALDSSRSPVAGIDPLALASIPLHYEEVAAFGNLTYKFTDWFDLMGGLRWASNDQSYRQIIPGGLLIPVSDVPGVSDESVVTYAAGPRFHATKDTIAYFRVATGYRPGGPNAALPGVPRQVNSDDTVNYEVGVKAGLLGGRATADLAIFRTDWSDMQVLTTVNGISFFINANSARTQGAELALGLAASDRLRLGFNAAYLVAEITEDVPDLGLIAGTPLPSAPKWTASAIAEYESPVSGGWATNVGAGLRYVGARNNDLTTSASDPLRVKAYAAVDLHAGVSNANANWDLSLYARNIFDQRAYLSEGQVGDVLGVNPVFRQSVVLQPRTIGISVSRRFSWRR